MCTGIVLKSKNNIIFSRTMEFPVDNVKNGSLICYNYKDSVVNCTIADVYKIEDTMIITDGTNK